MRTICAWCQREGKPDFLHEKAPFDDPRETHGICDDHFVGLTGQIAEMARARAADRDERAA
jgi:hypothetical protein